MRKFWADRRIKKLNMVLCLTVMTSLLGGCTDLTWTPAPTTLVQETTAMAETASQTTGVTEMQTVETTEAETTAFVLERPDTAKTDLERDAYASIDADIDAAIIELQRKDYCWVKEEVVLSMDYEPYVDLCLRFDRMNDAQKKLCTSLANAARHYEYFRCTSEEYGEQIIVPALTVHTVFSHNNVYESSYASLNYRGMDTVEILYYDPDGDANDRIDPESPEMATIQEKMKYMDAVISRILERMPEGLSTYQKYYYLGLVICAHCDYDTEGENANDFTAYGALTQGTVVCEGYAKAYQLLCERADLFCQLENGFSKDTGHMWNLIALETGTYHVDLTWCDSYEMTDYRWFFNFACSEDENVAMGRMRDADNSLRANGKSLSIE